MIKYSHQSQLLEYVSELDFSFISNTPKITQISDPTEK